MTASPINPSDIARLKNIKPGETADYIPGLEGSGRVAATGKGIFPRILSDKRVACSAKRHTSGAWAEYMVTAATGCFPVSKAVTFEQASMHIVNPLTAVAFYDIIRRYGHRAVISTAAAGALGKMIGVLGRKHGVPVIHIVRNEIQEKQLHAAGEKYVLNSSPGSFPELLRELAGRLNATLALDAVGGKETRTLLKALPPGGTLLLYGNLSGEQPEIDHKALVTDNKKVSGFYLGNHMKDQGMLRTIRSIIRAKKLIKQEFSVSVQARFPLEHAQLAVETYTQHMTAGKVLLICSESSF
jgi:NADPH:quinone reductase-like Zn-dependent oxidoreductase